MAGPKNMLWRVRIISASRCYPINRTNALDALPAELLPDRDSPRANKSAAEGRSSVDRRWKTRHTFRWAHAGRSIIETKAWNSQSWNGRGVPHALRVDHPDALDNPDLFIQCQLRDDGIC